MPANHQPDTDETRQRFVLSQLMGHHRTAFTLVELMTVLVILIVIMGISIGSLATFRKGNRLIAGGQMVSDLIRQARHTARSSGAPVVLRLTERTDANGRVIGGEISGISQTTLCDEQFERDSTWQDPDDKDANANPLPTMGRAGHGLQIKVAGSTLKWPLDPSTLALKFANNDRSRRIVRSSKSHDGFVLSTSVFVPPIQTTAGTSYATAAVAAGRYHWPLMLIGEAATPDVSTSLAGLMLRKHIRPQDRMNPANGLSSVPRVMITWELLGWINDGTSLTWISSVEDHADLVIPIAKTSVVANRNHLASWVASDFLAICSPNPDPLTRDGINPLSWTDPVNDLPVTINGGKWIEVGLVYDGRELSLLLDGKLINRKDVSQLTLPTPSPEDQFDQLWIGTAVLPPTASYPEASGGTAIYAESPMCFDDVRLLRLGLGQAMPLPTGVRPWTGHAGVASEIVAFPDGRCALRGVGTTPLSLNSIILAETTNQAFITNPQADPGKSQGLVITVDTSGSMATKAYNPATDKP